MNIMKNDLTFDANFDTLNPNYKTSIVAYGRLEEENKYLIDTKVCIRN